MRGRRRRSARRPSRRRPCAGTASMQPEGGRKERAHVSLRLQTRAYGGRGVGPSFPANLPCRGRRCQGCVRFRGLIRETHVPVAARYGEPAHRTRGCNGIGPRNTIPIWQLRRSSAPTPSGASCSPPSSTTSCAAAAPSAPSPARTGTPRMAACTAAPAAAQSCSAPRRSSTPAPAGPASTSRRGRRGRAARGHELRHAARRGQLRALRRAPRARLPGRPEADGAALLHELLLAGPASATRPEPVRRRRYAAAEPRPASISSSRLAASSAAILYESANVGTLKTASTR